MYDVIIIGGGPAGVAAGIYAARKALKTLLITNNFGGQSINSNKIENIVGYEQPISGIDYAQTLEKQLKSQANVDVKEGVFVASINKKEDGFEVADSAGNSYQSKAVLLAMGSGYKKLGITGESKFEGKGVFYCSICDAPLMKNKTAVVIGGGNSGLEAVVDLLPYANKIYLLTHADALKGDQVTQDQINQSNKVEIITKAETFEIFGDNFVKGIKYKDLNTNREKQIDTDGIFVEIGHKPNTELVKNLIQLNERGQIKVDHQTFKTSSQGIWAAGDITDGLYNQINSAIGDGVNAVLNIYDYLKLNK